MLSICGRCKNILERRRSDWKGVRGSQGKNGLSDTGGGHEHVQYGDDGGSCMATSRELERRRLEQLLGVGEHGLVPAGHNVPLGAPALDAGDATRVAWACLRQ